MTNARNNQKPDWAFRLGVILFTVGYVSLLINFLFVDQNSDLSKFLVLTSICLIGFTYWFLPAFMRNDEDD